MTEIGLEHYLGLSGALFAVGFMGVLLRRNVLIVLMCLELMLTASILALASFSRFNVSAGRPMMDGPVFVLFIIAIAACEVAVGLAIIVALWRRYQTVNLNEINGLKS